MALTLTHRTRMPAVLGGLIALQAACVLFFVWDVAADFAAMLDGLEDGFHLYVESIATLGLVAAIVFEAGYLRRLLRREAHLEKSLEIATAAVHDVIEAHFDRWGFTPAERDVATFLVKGLTTSEIAGMRGSAEGTVKAQLNAIYRKSQTRNRAELLSILIESLMGQDAEPRTRTGPGACREAS